MAGVRRRVRAVVAAIVCVGGIGVVRMCVYGEETRIDPKWIDCET